MNFKKILATTLSALMIISCFSFVATAEAELFEEAEHIAAYRVAGYDVVYVSDKVSEDGTGETPDSPRKFTEMHEVLNAVVTEDSKVVIAIDGRISSSWSIPNPVNGADVILTSATGANGTDGGYITVHNRSNSMRVTMFGKGESKYTFDNIHIELMDNQQNPIYAAGSDVTLTSTVTTNSVSKGLVVAHGRNATEEFTGGTIEIDTDAYIVRAGCGDGSNITGDVNYVIGENASIYYLYAGAHSNGTLNGSANVEIDGGTVTQLVPGYKAKVTGDIIININSGEVQTLKTNLESGDGKLLGDYVIYLNDGTIGKAEKFANGGAVSGNTVLVVNENNTVAPEEGIDLIPYVVSYTGDGEVEYDTANDKLMLTLGDTAKTVKVTTENGLKVYNQDVELDIVEGETTIVFSEDGKTQSTVTFIDTVGEGSVEETTYEIGEEIDIYEPDSVENYMFLGWADSIDGEMWYDGDVYTVTEDDVVFTAEWYHFPHVIFKASAEAGALEDYEETFYGEEGDIVEAPEAPETQNEHITFLGWAVEGTEEIVTDFGVYAENPVTYVAIFDIDELYTVTYKATVGTVPEAVTEYEGETITVEDGPTDVTGLTFAGWKLNDETVYQPGDTFTLTGNVTLTAIWEATDEPEHIAAYRDAGYNIVYVSDKVAEDGTGATFASPRKFNELHEVLNAVVTEDSKVVIAIDGRISSSWSVPTPVNGADVILTSSTGANGTDGGYITVYNRKATPEMRVAMFGVGESKYTFDNIHIQLMDNQQNPIYAAGSDVKLTSSVTTNSVSKGLVIAHGRNATDEFTGGTIEIDTDAYIVRAGCSDGSNITGDVNYVIGENATIEYVYAGAHSNGKLDGSAYVDIDGGTVAQLIPGYKAEITGDIIVNVNGGEVKKLRTNLESSEGKLGGDYVIYLNDGTIGTIEAYGNGGAVYGNTVLVVDENNAEIPATASAAQYLVSFMGNGEVEYDTANDVLKLTRGEGVISIKVNGEAIELTEGVDEYTVELTEKTTSIGFYASEKLPKVTYVYGQDIDTVEHEYESETVITLPGHDDILGFVFEGWTDGENNYAAGDEYTVTADVEFTAVWNEVEVATVSYNCVFEGVTIDSAEMNVGTVITLPTPANVDGQIFKGWTANEVEYDAGDEYTVTASVEFTAVWEEEIINHVPHIAAYANAGYRVVYVSDKATEDGTGKTPESPRKFLEMHEVLNAVVTENCKVVIAIDGQISSSWSVPNAVTGADVILTSATGANGTNGGYITVYNRSNAMRVAMFGKGESTYTFDNIHIQLMDNQQNPIYAAGSDVKLTSSVTTNSVSKGLVIAHGRNTAQEEFTGGTIEIDTDAFILRAGSGDGSKITGDVNYVIGENATIQIIGAGGHSNGQLQGNVNVDINGGKVAQFNPGYKADVTGDIIVNVNDGGEITTLKTNFEHADGKLAGDYVIYLNDGTIGAVEAFNGGTLSGKTVLVVNENNAEIPATASAAQHLVSFTGNGEVEYDTANDVLKLTRGEGVVSIKVNGEAIELTEGVDEYTVELTEKTTSIGFYASEKLPKVTYVYGQDFDTVEHEYEAGTVITLPGHDNILGFAFAGWTDGENTYAAGAEYTVTADVEFTAVWNEIEVATVSYNCVFEGVTIDSAEMNAGTVIVLPEPGFVNGQIFKGWTDGENTYNAGDEYTVTASVEFTAVWEEEIINHVPHIAAYADAGYRVVYVSDKVAEDGTGKTFESPRKFLEMHEVLNTVVTENCKVVIAIDGQISSSWSVPNAVNGADVILTSATGANGTNGGYITVYNRSNAMRVAMFGAGESKYTFDNIHIQLMDNQQNPIYAAGSDVKFTSSVTTNSVSKGLVVAHGRNAADNFTGGTIEIDTNAYLLRAGAGEGTNITGDINYVIGENATIQTVYAGGHAGNKDIPGTDAGTLKGSANVTINGGKVVQLNPGYKVTVTGNIIVNVNDGGEITTLKTNFEGAEGVLNGDYVIYLNDGTIGTVEAFNGGTLSGKTVLIVNENNAVVPETASAVQNLVSFTGNGAVVYDTVNDVLKLTRGEDIVAIKVNGEAIELTEGVDEYTVELANEIAIEFLDEIIEEPTSAYTVVLNNLSGAKGETVTLTVSLENYETFSSTGAGVKVDYDESVIEFVRVTGFQQPAGAFGACDKSANGATVSYTFAGATNVTLQNAVLFTAEFKLVGEPGEYDDVFSFRETTYAGENGRVEFATKAATVTIQEASAPEPETYTVAYVSDKGTAPVAVNGEAGTTITLSAPEAFAGYVFYNWTDGTTTYNAGDEFEITGDVTLTAVWYLKGDVNMNGTVNVADAIWIFDFISGKNEFENDAHKAIADMNDNDAVNVADAIEIFNYIAS